MSLNILNIVQSSSERVVDVDDEDFPVGLSLIEQSHDTQDFDLFDLSDVSYGFTNLTDVQWVVVTVRTGFGVFLLRVFPGLGEGTVVPDVTVVGETVSDVSKLSLFDV